MSLLIFLQSLAQDSFDPSMIPQGSQMALLGPILAILAAFFILFFIIGIALYIFSSLAFYKIAKRTNTSSPGLAWIPGIGPIIIAYKIAKMHWWPWLMLGVYLLAMPLMIIPVIGPILAAVLMFPAMLIFAIFAIIWQWKMLEALGRPGWWVLLILIPFAGPIVYLILIGVAAWGEKKK